MSERFPIRSDRPARPISRCGLCLGLVLPLLLALPGPTPARQTRGSQPLSPADLLRGAPSTGSRRPASRVSQPEPSVPPAALLPESENLPLILPPLAGGDMSEPRIAPRASTSPLTSNPTLPSGTTPPAETGAELALPEINPPAGSEPRVLESQPLGPLPGDRPIGTRPLSSRPESRMDQTSAPNRPIPSSSARSSNRRGPLVGLFDRVLGRPPSRLNPTPDQVVRQSVPSDPAPTSTRSSQSTSTEESDRVKDETARKRIESEIIRVSGDRIRELEVSVSAKKVTINAVATRFYLRRGVRRDIESLGILRGYAAKVNVR